MGVVVIGGGLIGSKLIALLRHRGEEARAAAPEAGIDTLTGRGLAEVLAGAQVVIDVENSPSVEDEAAMSFFETSSRHLLAAEAAVGVTHHIALSVVGTDRLQEGGYFRAKMLQETLIKASGVPYTILRSTQFFEFVDRIAESASDGRTVRLSPALVQPILSDDVVRALADIVMAPPANDTIEVAGPERFQLDELVRHLFSAKRDRRHVITDARARYFGAELDDHSLMPDAGAHIFGTRFETWLGRASPK